MVVGHNVAFDRAFIREQYLIQVSARGRAASAALLLRSTGAVQKLAPGELHSDASCCASLPVSWSNKMVWVGRDLKAHPPAMGWVSPPAQAARGSIRPGLGHLQLRAACVQHICPSAHPGL